MSDAIVCHGCGARLTVPDGYARNKMQCPECGVICSVAARPAAAKKAEAPAPPQEETLFDDEPAAAPPPRSAAPPPPTETITAEPTPAGKGLANCPHCGELVRIPGRKKNKPAMCPACGADWPKPEAKKKPAPQPVAVTPPADEFAGSTPDEDPDSGNPYRTADRGARRCPGCSNLLGPEIVVCVRCGFDLRTGRKTVKEYGKFERSWDSGMQPATRRLLFLLCQAAAAIAIAVAFLTLPPEESRSIAVVTFLCSWLIYTGMTAFLLGTYDHIHLKRFKSGRVQLIKTWRVAFIPFRPQDIDVRSYFGVVGGRQAHVGAWEWIIFLFLLISAVVPGLIWWYCTIYKIVYYVSLTNEHGAPEMVVYRGWGEEQMQEVQEALRTALTV
ncbi:MAG TPA: hypothetical protein VMS17_05520 [Gemmataceae bacterium]|nr:hypothetical protein [Gemmataceae bacterium]